MPEASQEFLLQRLLDGEISGQGGEETQQVLS